MGRRSPKKKAADEARSKRNIESAVAGGGVSNLSKAGSFTVGVIAGVKGSQQKAAQGEKAFREKTGLKSSLDEVSARKKKKGSNYRA
jgi:hypothetical protein